LSNTPSAGNPEERQGCSPVVVLIAGVLALVFAVLVGPRSIGILLALAAPPDPPLPDDTDLALVSHENLAHGVDEWVYTTGQEVCAVVRFYYERDGQCPIVPSQCSLSPDDNDQDDASSAFCHGDVDFSIFSARWRFRVFPDDILTGTMRFRLSRVVSWTGSFPAETP